MLNKKLLSSSDSKYAWVTFDVSGLVGSGPTEFLIKKGDTLSTVMNDFPDYDYSGNYSHLGKWYYSGSSQNYESMISLTETKITRDCVIAYGTKKYNTLPSSGSIRVVVNPGSHGYTSKYNGKYYYYGYKYISKFSEGGDSITIGSASASGDISYFEQFGGNGPGYSDICTTLNIFYVGILTANICLRTGDYDYYFKKKTRMYVTPKLMVSGSEVNSTNSSDTTSHIYDKYKQYSDTNFQMYYHDPTGNKLPFKAYTFKNGNTYTIKWEPIE